MNGRGRDFVLVRIVSVGCNVLTYIHIYTAFECVDAVFFLLLRNLFVCNSWPFLFSFLLFFCFVSRKYLDSIALMGVARTCTDEKKNS